MNKNMFMIPILFILAGCSLLNNSTIDQIPLTGKIVVDQSKYEIMAEEYIWVGKNGKIKRVDPDSPIESAKSFESISVDKKEKIGIYIIEEFDEINWIYLSQD